MGSLGVVRRMETGSTRGRCRQTSTAKLITRAARLLQTVCLCPTRGGTTGTARAWCSLRTAGTMARGAEDGDGQHAGGMPADLDSTKLITRAARLLHTVCLCPTRG